MQAIVSNSYLTVTFYDICKKLSVFIWAQMMIDNLYEPVGKLTKKIEPKNTFLR